MSVPEVFIRDDGKGFIVRKGGVDLTIYLGANRVEAFNPQSYVYGMGETIMEAVDNAILKMKAKE